MITITMLRQDVEMVIELLEKEPHMQAHWLAADLRKSICWKPQSEDASYVPPPTDEEARRQLGWHLVPENGTVPEVPA